MHNSNFSALFHTICWAREGKIRHLQAAESLDKLLAEEASHLYIIDVVERRIEMADIVDHLYQIVHIDDVFLVNLHKLCVELLRSDSLFTLRFSRTGRRHTSYHNLPATA